MSIVIPDGARPRLRISTRSSKIVQAIFPKARPVTIATSAVTTAAGFPPCWSMDPSQFHVSKCSGSAGGGRSSHRTRLPGRVIAAPTRLYAQQGKRARVYRNDDRVSNDQRVHGRRPHGRRSVDEDDIEVGQDRCPAQEKLAIDLFLPPGGRRPRYQWSSAGVSNEDESQRGTGQCRASR